MDVKVRFAAGDASALQHW